MSRGINALLLDSCVEYQRFVDEQRTTNYNSFCRTTLHHWNYQRHACRVWTWGLCAISAQNDYAPLWQKLYGRLFSSIHNLSHPGANASIRLMSDRFVWLWMKTNVLHRAKACVQCQKAKVRRHTRSPLVSFPSPDERFTHMHVNFTRPLLLCEGQSYLLTCVDRFSGWCEALLMLDITAKTLLQAGYLILGSQQWLSQTGKQFESNLFNQLRELKPLPVVRTQMD